MDALTESGGTRAFDAGFIIDVESFNGPLDLLLALLRDEQLAIYDIDFHAKLGDAACGCF